MSDDNDSQSQANRLHGTPAQSSAASIEAMEGTARGGASPGAAGAVADPSPLGAYRRMRLNPASGESQFKAVPSLPEGEVSRASAAIESPDAAASTIPAEPAPWSSSSDISEREHPAPVPGNDHTADGNQGDAGRSADLHKGEDISTAPKGTTVEIPPPVGHLGAEMEAEIEAAMASGELEPAPNVPTPSAADEGEEDESHERPTEDALEPGHHLTGRIQSIHADGVFLDLGYRSPGL